MRSTVDLTQRYTEAMKAAYKATDSVSFTVAALGLKEAALAAIAGGYHSEGATALNGLSEGLECVVCKRSGDRSHMLDRTTPEFLAAVMPLFGVNSREVAQNMGVSPEIDDYLLNNKIDFSQISYSHKMSSFMFHCLRLGLVDEFVAGYGGACDDLRSKQLASLQISDARVGDPFRYCEQTTLLQVFQMLSDASVPVPSLPEALDDKLSNVLSELCGGDSSVLRIGHFRAMRAAGLEKSIRAAMGNIYSSEFDLGQAAWSDLSVKDAVHMLGINCYKYSGASLVQHLVGHDPKAVRDAMHPVTYKASACKPENLLRSCAAYAQSEMYQPQDIPVLLALMESAYVKVKRSQKLKKGEGDFEVFHEHMSKAGVPMWLQLKIPMIRDNKGAILEHDLGM